MGESENLIVTVGKSRSFGVGIEMLLIVNRKFFPWLRFLPVYNPFV